MSKKAIRKIVFIIMAASAALAAYSAFAQNVLLKDSYTVIEGGTLTRSLPYLISADNSRALSAQSAGRLSDGRVVSPGYSSRIVLKLLGVIPVKEVNVNVIKSPEVTVSGECIGVKLYAGGLITVGVTDFKTEGGSSAAPALEAGIKAGDIIKSVNGTAIESISHFSGIMDEQRGECTLKILRSGEEMQIELTPQRCTDGHMRAGVWVRDSVAGIGTMTFSENKTNEFAALGHGISDTDTDILIPLRDGKIYSASILGITKGKKGVPGEIAGALNEGCEMGSCTKNLETGIYGSLYQNKDSAQITIAPGSEIQKGDAAVICTLDERGPVEYSVKILNISRLSKSSKAMIIKITDPALISKTGGIVQGMSGSPIIQNGRLIGAVTHVFVNDPSKGYAIFAETMLNNLSKY